jgi:hypothetical protein
MAMTPFVTKMHQLRQVDLFGNKRHGPHQRVDHPARRQQHIAGEQQTPNHQVASADRKNAAGL